MPSFFKTYPQQPPEAAHAEADGLERLRRALSQAGDNGIRVPAVHAVTEGRLELESITLGPASEALMTRLGEGLARLHTLRQPHYGLERDNFIGLSPQYNAPSNDWGRFFLHQRLMRQVAWIGDTAFRDRATAVLEQHGPALITWLNRQVDYPSLLHGDLWAGNAVFDDQYPWLIDPAVYCGDREADLAMSELFGGFSNAFYQAYDRILPRSRHYPIKREIYNLYHLLNHYNLFGSPYQQGCEKSLEIIAARRFESE